MILGLCAQEIHKLSIASYSSQGIGFFEEREAPPELFLSSLVEVLKKQNRDFASLEALFVITGPGSFTATRIIVAIANTLGFVYRIPLIGKEKPLTDSFIVFLEEEAKKIDIKKIPHTILEPAYDRPPNITPPAPFSPI